jgi:hypothetical protein
VPNQLKFGSGWALALISLPGLLAWVEPTFAASCHVPAALLCEGCAKHLAIRVGTDGLCRINFKSALSTGSIGSNNFVDIDVETTTPRRPAHGLNGARWSHFPTSEANIGGGAQAFGGGYTTCGRNGCQFVPNGCIAIPHMGGHGLGGRIFC